MTFVCERVWEIFYFLSRFPDSRHVQLAICSVFHEESESAVGSAQFLHLEDESKTKQLTRVSISYRNISYYTGDERAKSPPRRVFGHNSAPWSRRGTRIGRDEAYKPPGAF